MSNSMIAADYTLGSSSLSFGTGCMIMLTEDTKIKTQDIRQQTWDATERSTNSIIKFYLDFSFSSSLSDDD